MARKITTGDNEGLYKNEFAETSIPAEPTTEEPEIGEEIDQSETVEDTDTDTDTDTAEIATIEFHTAENVYVVVFTGDIYPLIIPGNELSPDQDDQDIIGRIEYELSQRVPVEAFSGLKGYRVQLFQHVVDSDTNESTSVNQEYPTTGAE